MPITTKPTPKGIFCRKCNVSLDDKNNVCMIWPSTFETFEPLGVCEECFEEYHTKYHILHVEYFGE